MNIGGARIVGKPDREIFQKLIKVIWAWPINCYFSNNMY